MCRVIVSLVALLGVTAFAPAPFPKPSRGGESAEISVHTCQGTWRVASMRASRRDGNHTPYQWNITHIRIKGDNWTFLQDTSANASYTIAIENGRRPASIDFWSGPGREGKAPGQGIIRRRGDRVEMIYVFSEAARAVSFEQPPDNQWVLTLQRVGE